MPQSRSSSTAQTIAKLAQPRRVEALHPIAARFVYSLRLIALHERAKRDPVPELAMRLGSIELAAKSLAMGQAISSTWPENIQISRFCCSMMSHDEATIGALIEGAATGDRTAFETEIQGFIRPERMHRLWEAAFGLVSAQARAC